MSTPLIDGIISHRDRVTGGQAVPLVVTRCQLCHSPMPTERADSWCQICAERDIDSPHEFYGFASVPDDFGDPDFCGRCGGDGVINLSDAPDLWGEDCFCEIDRLVTCPSCQGKGV